MEEEEEVMEEVMEEEGMGEEVSEGEVVWAWEVS